MRFMQMTYRRDGNLLEEKRLDIPVINTWPDYQPLAQSIMGMSHQWQKTKNHMNFFSQC